MVPLEFLKILTSFLWSISVHDGPWKSYIIIIKWNGNRILFIWMSMHFTRKYLYYWTDRTTSQGHGKLPTYPSPKPTLTVTSHFGQNVGLGEGRVSSFPKTYDDPHLQGTGKTFIFSVFSGPGDRAPTSALQSSALPTELILSRLN